MLKEQPATATLTEGEVAPALRDLAVPMAVGIVFIIAVNLIDTWYVGRLGLDALAAMSFTFPVVTLVMSIAMGLSVGAMSAIARAIGHGDQQQVRRLTTHAMFLALLVVLLVSGVGLSTQGLFFELVGAEEQLIPLIEDYMTVWYIGAVFLVVPIVANGAMRAQGDAKSPARMMAFAALANFILDPIFIFGFGAVPAMGLKGAAIATLIARASTMAMAIYLLMVRHDMLDLHVPTAVELFGSWKKILSVGLPAAVSNALGPVAIGLLTTMVAGFGSAAVAAYGIGSRIDGLLLIAPMALSSALAPFIGQNWGAHLTERVTLAIKVSMRFAVIWGLAGFAVLQLAAGPIARLFTDDPAALAAVELYLSVVSFGYAAQSIVSIVNASFNAVDRAVRATVLSAAKSLGLAVPMAWAGSLLLGLPGIFAGLVAAAVVTAIVGAVWVRHFLDPQRQLSVSLPEAVEPEAAAAGMGMLEPASVFMSQLTGEDGLTVHRCRRDALGIYDGERELGHVHIDGALDLPLPPPLAEALVRRGQVQHHRLHHDSGWVTAHVDDSAAVSDALWLLSLARALYALRTRGCDDQGAKKALEQLGVEAEVLGIVDGCTRLWPEAEPVVASGP